jgi:hypothetical protein
MEPLSDTAPETRRVLVELLRALPPWRKLQLVSDLITAARELIQSGLKQRYPDATEAELRRRLAAALLGPEMAARAYGPPKSGDSRNAG